MEGEIFYPVKLKREQQQEKMFSCPISQDDPIGQYLTGPQVQKIDQSTFVFLRDEVMPYDFEFFARYKPIQQVVLLTKKYSYFYDLIDNNLHHDNSMVLRLFKDHQNIMLFGLPRTGKTTALMTIRDFFREPFYKGQIDIDLKNKLNAAFQNSLIAKYPNFAKLKEKQNKYLVIDFSFQGGDCDIVYFIKDKILQSLKRTFGDDIQRSDQCKNIINAQFLTSVIPYIIDIAKKYSFQKENVLLLMDQIQFPLFRDLNNVNIKRTELGRKLLQQQIEIQLRRYNIIVNFLKAWTKDQGLFCVIAGIQPFFQYAKSGRLVYFRCFYTHQIYDILMPQAKIQVDKIYKKFNHSVTRQFVQYLVQLYNGPQINKKKFVNLFYLNQGLKRKTFTKMNALEDGQAYKFAQKINKCLQNEDSQYNQFIDNMLQNEEGQYWTNLKQKTSYEIFAKNWPGKLNCQNFFLQLANLNLVSIKRQEEEIIYVVKDRPLLKLFEKLINKQTTLYEKLKKTFKKQIKTDPIIMIKNSVQQFIQNQPQTLIEQSEASISFYFYCFYYSYCQQKKLLFAREFHSRVNGRSDIVAQLQNQKIICIEFKIDKTTAQEALGQILAGRKEGRLKALQLYKSKQYGINEFQNSYPYRLLQRIQKFEQYQLILVGLSLMNGQEEMAYCKMTVNIYIEKGNKFIQIVDTSPIEGYDIVEDTRIKQDLKCRPKILRHRR